MNMNLLKQIRIGLTNKEFELVKMNMLVEMNMFFESQ